MPPKKGTSTAKAAPSRTSTRQKKEPETYTPVPPTTTKAAGKRKAAEELTNEPNTKRKRSIPQSEDSPSAVSKTTKTAATKKTAAAKTKGPAAAVTKKTAPAKRVAAPKKSAPTAAPKASRKAAPKPKAEPKTKTAPAIKVAAPRPRRALPIINDVPTQVLDVFTFGGGESGELGHGPKVKEVKRPRLNAFLSSDSAKIVAVSVGGMHTLALSADNKIWSWGVNDQGALGRDTTWSGGLRDMDDDKSDSDSDEADLNPVESTPATVPDDAFPEGTIISSIAAGDSCSFAVTNEGLVYGWGTFRSNEGILGFSPDTYVQNTPVLMKELKNIKSITCGANHAIALDKSGSIFCWGAGEQNQLGRRLTKSHLKNGLKPTLLGGKLNKKVRLVGAGAMHSFAITKDDKVYAWGLNQYGQFGTEVEDVRNEADIPIILPVEPLSGRNISVIKGGSHHSLAVDGEGKCLVWGRCDGSQTGLDLSTIPAEHMELDVVSKPAKLRVPTAIPDLDCAYATTESDHSIAITKDGKAYSWGFSANYQTGLGTDDDVDVATLIDNTAVRDKKLTWVGAGGQFSVLAAPAT